jgi:deoxyribodipyrimidine photo-lyase
LGWQWAGGCGADAAPYFRIFNPELQGEKFDPHGEYVRQWVPELKRLESKFIHNPSKAPPLVLHAAGIELGETYPKPMIDHSAARKRALEALASIKGAGDGDDY